MTFINFTDAAERQVRHLMFISSSGNHISANAFPEIAEQKTNLYGKNSTCVRVRRQPSTAHSSEEKIFHCVRKRENDSEKQEALGARTRITNKKNHIKGFHWKFHEIENLRVRQSSLRKLWAVEMKPAFRKEAREVLLKWCSKVERNWHNKRNRKADLHNGPKVVSTPMCFGRLR